MKQVGALFLLLGVAGCGGGGGGSGSDLRFAGTWRGDLVVTQNTCRDAVGNRSIVHNVNENGDAIAIRTTTGFDFSGFTNAENAFTVAAQFTDQCVSSRTGQPVPGSFAQTVVTIVYADVLDDEALVTVTNDTGNCSSNNAVNTSACKIVEQGRFIRDAQ